MRIQKQQWPSVLPQWALLGTLLGALGLAGATGHGRASLQVRAGDDLQAVLDRAAPGDVIRLEAGARFTGSFVLRAHGGGAPITIRTDASDDRLPSASQRIDPSYAPLLPTLTPSGAGPVLKTAPGAGAWHLMGLRIAGNGGGDLITLGDGGDDQFAYANVPAEIVLDRLLIVGDPARGQKRGIALNSAATTIRNSYIADIKAAGQESQAIAGWNGPGPYLIENNHLEAAGMAVLFGGAEPAIGGLVPGDITIRRNTLTRPLAWREEHWTVKNLLELKNARRVLIEGNRLEHNWSAAQAGFAVLFTVRSSGPRADWSTVEDVTFRHNIVRHVAGGINILGHDTAVRSQQAHGMVIHNNLFYDVDHERWGGNGAFLQVGEEAADITIDRNTIVQSGNLVTVYGGTRANPRPVRGFRFRNNIGWHNAFGITGTGYGSGTPAIQAYFPDAEIVGNVLVGAPEARYPAGNRYPPEAEVLGEFERPNDGGYRLRTGSWLRTAGIDGGAVGVDLDALIRLMAGLGLR